MRTKKERKPYKDYHSSDYGNEEEEEDYGKDYEDEAPLNPDDSSDGNQSDDNN